MDIIKVLVGVIVGYVLQYIFGTKLLNQQLEYERNTREEQRINELHDKHIENLHRALGFITIVTTIKYEDKEFERYQVMRLAERIEDLYTAASWIDDEVLKEKVEKLFTLKYLGEDRTEFGELRDKIYEYVKEQY